MSNQSIQSVTPRASHVSSPDTLRYSDSEYDSDSDTEYVDADEWFKWFKTTEEYKNTFRPITNVIVKMEPEPVEPVNPV